MVPVLKTGVQKCTVGSNPTLSRFNMLYFIQTNVPEKRQIHKGLLAIYGLGMVSSNKLVASLGLLEETRGIDLRLRHTMRFKSLLNDYPRLIGAELRNKNKSCVQSLIDIDSYRGRRHKNAYPVRGQRTHTNAKTQKILYRRWEIKNFEKPKQSFTSIKNPKVQLKAKKAKGEKAKKKTVAKAPKLAKYKI